jgi:acetylornithine deacetylase/succinyl-diaminopimelate desuccinylase-like protein
MADALQEETAEVLGQLVRFDTVNPPGAERAAQEWLAAYLEEAGLEVELAGRDPERPNLVASLQGEAEDGPVLGYLSHMDTVLATAGDWTRDPWSGEVHDGFLWGRGAIDMKSQTAAEAVAAASLARSGWRPPRGELKIICVADEEAGGAFGAQWLTEERPDLARCDWLVNEGGGAAMPFGDRRLHGVCCAEKGTFRFAIRTTGKAGHASTPALADNALVKLAPVLERLATRRPDYDLTEEPRALISALGMDPDEPAGAIERIREVEPRLAAWVEPTMGITMAPTRIAASEKINVIPALAELKVDCRVPPGMDGEATMRRIREVVGDDGLDVAFTEEVIGNRSPIDSPLMDAIRAWVGEQDPDAEVVPVVLPAFTDSRWWRAAFPQCVAYGFFPQRHQSLYETWPLIHGADERIDVRDLGYAAAFFADLPRKLLGDRG